MNVPVRRLKNQLSAYLRRVQGGATVTVTDHGRPIATLSPLEISDGTPRQRLERLEQAGEVTAPLARRRRSVKPARVRGGPLSKTVLEDRR